MKLNRIGVIGDVHAEPANLERTLKFMLEENLDQIVCVGDIVQGTKSIDACCELLESHNVITVSGNHDRWSGANKEFMSLASARFISSLPATQKLETMGGSALLCHGLGEDDMKGVLPWDSGYAIEMNFELHDLIRSKEFRFIINGHTHKRMVRTFGTMTIINGGTIKSTHQPCFTIIDFGKEIVNFYDLGDSITLSESIELNEHAGDSKRPPQKVLQRLWLALMSSLRLAR
jgi:putative phosphoesterase